jgi:creatinine amidohydrolase
MSKSWMPLAVTSVIALRLMAGPPAAAQIYNVAELTTTEIESLDRSKTVVVLPNGILEEHGPYLPSFTDGYMAERLTRDLAESIVKRPGWNALVFPMIPLGNGGANEIARKYSFSGTYTVRFATLRAVFMDLASELGEQGFRWIFVVHSHGAPNHSRALDQAGDYFHDTYGGQMVNLAGIAFPSGRASEHATKTEEQEQEDGFTPHAGMVETSRVKFLRPDLVKDEVSRAKPLTARNWDDLEPLAKADDWPGYWGSPRLATAAFGANHLDTVSSALVEVASGILDGDDPRELARSSDEARNNPVNVAIDADAIDHDREIRKKQQDWLVGEGLSDDNGPAN